MRCARKRMSRISGEAAHDRWAEPSRHRKGQPFPQLDKHPKFWIERVQIRDLAPRCHAVLVDQRRRFETPIAFEIVGSCPPLAAPKVKQTKTALAGAPRHLPIHEVIRRQPTCVSGASAVIGQYLVSKIEIHYRGDQ